MKSFLIELEYYKDHIPELMMLLIPRVMVGCIILQILLGVLKHISRSPEKANSITIFSVTMWAIMLALFGLYLYYYIVYFK